jgi:hypothetical protein
MSSTDAIIDVPTVELPTSTPPQSAQEVEDLIRLGLMEPIGAGGASIVYRVRNLPSN